MPTIHELTVKGYRTTYVKQPDGTRVKKQVPYKGQRPVEYAGTGNRIVHALIDGLIVVGIEMTLPLLFLPAGKEAMLMASEFMTSVLPSMLIFFLYYFICEQTLQTTVGKLVTGCVVIDDYAEKPDTGTLLLRTLTRMVPFEGLSCFNDRGWHDQWSKTNVVKRSERDALKALLKKQEEEDQQALLSITQS